MHFYFTLYPSNYISEAVYQSSSSSREITIQWSRTKQCTQSLDCCVRWGLQTVAKMVGKPHHVKWGCSVWNVKSLGRLNKCLLNTASTLLGAKNTVINKAGQAKSLLSGTAVLARGNTQHLCWEVLWREMHQDKGGRGLEEGGTAWFRIWQEVSKPLDDGNVGDADTHTDNYNTLWGLLWRNSEEA